MYTVGPYHKWLLVGRLPDDLKTRESSRTSCQLEIYFSIQTAKFLMKYNLLSAFKVSLGLEYFGSYLYPLFPGTSLPS